MLAGEECTYMTKAHICCCDASARNINK